ncbi:hypothetical protein ACWC9U_35610 [Streptomyces sp. 900116325]
MPSIDEISTAAAVVAALIALAALYFARTQAKSAERQTSLQQKMREDAAQPYVWADIRPHQEHGQLFQLLLKNEGPTVAVDVAVRFDPPLKGWRDPGRQCGPATDENSVARFKALPPGRTMIWHLGTTHEALKQGPTRYEVTVDGTGPSGRIEQLRYVIDLAEYTWAATTVPGSLFGIAASIDKATSQLEKITGRIEAPNISSNE